MTSSGQVESVVFFPELEVRRVTWANSRGLHPLRTWPQVVATIIESLYQQMILVCCTMIRPDDPERSPQPLHRVYGIYIEVGHTDKVGRTQTCQFLFF